jgi:hypothetical protein
MSEMVQSDRTSKMQRVFLQPHSADLLEQLAELEWLREQVRQETLDTQQMLARFKARRQQIRAKRRTH